MRARSALAVVSSIALVASLAGAIQPAAATSAAPPGHGAALPTIVSVEEPEGPASGGTRVLIRGDHLAHPTSVTFGHRTASRVTVLGAHKVVAVTPRHQVGEVVVHVITGAGKSPVSSGSEYRFGRTNRIRWSDPESVDPPRGAPSALSCPTETFCALVDSSGGLITFDGTSWTDATPSQVNDWDAVYCWSDQLCFADSRGSISRYDGTTWSTPVPTFAVTLAAVTCWSDVGCRAFDWKGREFRYKGTGWSPTGRTVDNVIGLTCSAAQSCTALDAFGSGYRYDGTAWTSSAGLPSDRSVDWDACAPDGTCVATTEDRFGTAAYQFDGTQWQAIADLPSTAYSLSCSSANFCAAMSDQATASIYDGSEWSSPISLGLVGQRLQSVVACAPGDSCMAIDHFGTAATFDRTTARQAGLADPLRGGVLEVSCPTATWCMSIDSYRNWLIRSEDGSWSSPTPGSGNDALSCSSAAFCVSASGSQSWVWHGAAWSRLPDLPSGFEASSSSCPVDGYCVMVDDNGRTQVLTNHAWHASGHPLAASSVVSCWSKGNCLAVGRRRAALLAHGAWTADTAIAGPNAHRRLTSVDCSTRQTCLVGTYGGAVMTVTGNARTITDHVLSAPVEQLDCATDSSCVAAGSPSASHGRESAVYDSTGWTASAPIDDAITSLSCPTTTACIAVGKSSAYTASVPAD